LRTHDHDIRSLFHLGLLSMAAAVATACSGAVAVSPSSSTGPIDAGTEAGAGVGTDAGAGVGTDAGAGKAAECTEGERQWDGVCRTVAGGLGRTCIGGRWVAMDTPCTPPPVCKAGDVHPSGCACSCEAGQWVCPGGGPAPVCTEHATRFEGCKECWCSGGQWLCAGVDCAPGDGGIDAGPAPTRCGGPSGASCAADEYCAYSMGQCSRSDASGICQPRPRICSTICDDVCGCDGKSYSNGCAAAMAGIAVSHGGMCP
jgi:hypothetical protein